VVIETDDYNIPTPAAKAAAKKKREEEQQLRTAATAARPSAMESQVSEPQSAVWRNRRYLFIVSPR
jgi:hypothetical protein